MFPFRVSSLILLPCFLSHAAITPQISWQEAGKDTYNLKIVSATTDTPSTSLWGCMSGCEINANLISSGKSLGPKKLKITGWNLLEKEMIVSITGTTWNVPAAYIPNGGNSCVSFSIKADFGTYPAGKACAASPIPVTACTIKENNLTVTHGTLSANELSGNTATTTLNLNCNNAADIVVTASNTTGDSDRIFLSPQITTDIKINGLAGLTGVMLKNTRSATVSLSSTLQSTGSVKGGDYAGSGLVKLNYQ